MIYVNCYDSIRHVYSLKITLVVQQHCLATVNSQLIHVYITKGEEIKWNQPLRVYLTTIEKRQEILKHELE